MPSQNGTTGSSQRRRALEVILVGFFLTLGLPRPSAAAVLECASGDVTCLIAAINTANASGAANTIRLQAGTYTLQAPDNDTDGSNGLPSITSALTIVGAGAANTIIERKATAPEFRLFHVTGLLKLEGLTVRGGHWSGSTHVPSNFGGGGLFNRGTAIISQSIVTGNMSGSLTIEVGGGGIASLGRLVVARSIISDNRTAGAGGGIASGPQLGIVSGVALTVIDSTIRGNFAANSAGGLWTAEGSLAIIIGSTIADNVIEDGRGGGLASMSQAVAIINSTLAGNFASVTSLGGGGLFVSGGIIVNTTIANNDAPVGLGDALVANSALAVYNTILGNPSGFGQPTCRGQITSLGNNVFTDPNCAVVLLPDDLTGDPRLGGFSDNGTPGHGFLPLLPGSPAINAGDDGACLPTDQIGRLRRGRHCDIGAIEGVGKAQRKRDDHDDDR